MSEQLRKHRELIANYVNAVRNDMQHDVKFYWMQLEAIANEVERDRRAQRARFESMREAGARQ